jgi:hypothetical protein
MKLSFTGSYWLVACGIWMGLIFAGVK